MKEYYKLSEVAKIANVHIQTIHRHVKSGKLKANKVGYNWRVSEKNLKEYLGE